MRSQGKTVRAFVASKLKRFLGVDPPESAIVKRPRCATASLAARTTSSAAAANNSCGVVSVRISTEELNGPYPSSWDQLWLPRTDAQRAAPSRPAFSLVTTCTGIDSTSGRQRPLSRNDL